MSETALQKQERIFTVLQERLLETAEDVCSDAELVADLASAVDCAADGLLTLRRLEEEPSFSEMFG